jgi:hypothetical protein
MKKISNNNTFANYIGKFIDVNIEGTIHKFLVSEIEAGSITTNAGILYPDSFSILRESPNQECDICDDVCVNNIPVIKVMFRNIVETFAYGSSTTINNFYGEIHELILNGTSLGRINTTFQKGKHNEIWFVPYDPSKVVISTLTYASSSNSSIYNTNSWGNIDSLVLSSFDSSLLSKNDYNEISIRPVSAWNPVSSDPGYPLVYNPPLSTAFFLSPLVTLDIHKILPLTTNTSSISCQSYTMHRFNNSSIDQFADSNSLRFHDPIDLDFRSVWPYVNNYMSAGCIFQTFSASFYYYDPCQIESPLYYPLDPEYYYTYATGIAKNIFGVKFAYGRPNEINMYPNNYLISDNPALPLLRKYEFFNSRNINDKLYLFVGSNTKNTDNFYLHEINDGYVDLYATRNIQLGYTNQKANNGFLGGTSYKAIYDSKYANKLFEGRFYALEDGTYDLGSGTVRFREMSVYTDSSLFPITQNISAGAVFNL